MNEQATKFWLAYWQNSTPPKNVRAYRFGDTPDELAELVAKGIKTATSNAKKLFEVNNKMIPNAGDYNIILNKNFEPVALIQITSVEIKPYDEIDEPFAIAEGDGSYENWHAIHERYFSEQLAKIQESFHPKLELVCQTFKLLKVNERNY